MPSTPQGDDQQLALKAAAATRKALHVLMHLKSHTPAAAQATNEARPGASTVDCTGMKANITEVKPTRYTHKIYTQA
jgi:hypothetical protein